MRVPTMNWWQVWRRYRWAALIWLLPALWLGVVGATQAQTPAPAPLAETIELTPGERAFVQRHPVVRPHLVVPQLPSSWVIGNAVKGNRHMAGCVQVN